MASVVLKTTRLDTYFKRLKGLMFESDIAEEHFFHIAPCKSVHTFFMRFNIDLIFIDNQSQIIEVFHDVPRGKICLNPHATSVLEARAGTAKHMNLCKGTVVILNNTML